MSECGLSLYCLGCGHQMPYAAPDLNRVSCPECRGEMRVANERPISAAEEDRQRLAPFRALVAAYPHEVDGWLVTHTEPGLTLGDLRRLVNANATGERA